MDENQITVKRYNFADDSDLPSGCKNFEQSKIKMDLDSKRESFWNLLMISPLLVIGFSEFYLHEDSFISRHIDIDLFLLEINLFLISIIIAICSFIYLKIRKIDDYLILDKTNELIFTYETTAYSKTKQIYLRFDEIRFVGVNLWRWAGHDQIEYYYVAAVTKQNIILPISPTDNDFNKISHFARFLAQTVNTKFIEDPQPGRKLYISNSLPEYKGRSLLP